MKNGVVWMLEAPSQATVEIPPHAVGFKFPSDIWKSKFWMTLIFSIYPTLVLHSLTKRNTSQLFVASVCNVSSNPGRFFLG